MTTLPIGLRSMASTNTYCSGTFCLAMSCAGAVGRTARPGRRSRRRPSTTNAQTRSPVRASGSPSDGHVDDVGVAEQRVLDLGDEMFSALRMIMSFRRPGDARSRRRRVPEVAGAEPAVVVERARRRARRRRSRGSTAGPSAGSRRRPRAPRRPARPPVGRSFGGRVVGRAASRSGNSVSPHGVQHRRRSAEHLTHSSMISRAGVGAPPATNRRRSGKSGSAPWRR